LVVPSHQRDRIKVQRFSVADEFTFCFAWLPSRNKAPVLIIALRFAVFSQVVVTEVSTTGLITVKSINTHELAEINVVSNAGTVLQYLVHVICRTWDTYVLPEVLAQFANLFNRGLQILDVTGYATAPVQNLTELTVVVRRTMWVIAADVHQAVNTRLRTFHSSLGLSRIFSKSVLAQVICQEVWHGKWQGEPSINGSRQQGVCTQAVCAVVGPRCLTSCEQAFNRRHFVEVSPQATHGEVAGRRNTHWGLVRGLTNGFLVHLNEVGVTLTDGVLAQTLNSIAQVQVNRVIQRTYTVAGVDLLRNCTGCNVMRHQVTERWVAALKEVIALVIRNGIRIAVVAFLLWRPNAAVVTQRLRHQNGLGLPRGVHRQTSWVELNKAWGSKESALLICTHQSASIRVLSQGRHVVDVAVATGTQDNCVTSVSLELAGDQVTGNDAASAVLAIVIVGDDVLHIVVSKKLHVAKTELTV